MAVIKQADNYLIHNDIVGISDDIGDLKSICDKHEKNIDSLTAILENTIKSVHSADLMICELEDKVTDLQKTIKLLYQILIIVAMFIGFAILYVVRVSAYEYTAEDIVQIGKIVQHECPNESELGKRLVIDTILNRVESDAFPNTVAEVLNQKGQYCNPKKYSPKEVYTLIAQEINDRTDKRVLWFKTNWYHSFGEPIVKEGSHYFSGR